MFEETQQWWWLELIANSKQIFRQVIPKSLTKKEVILEKNANLSLIFDDLYCFSNGPDSAKEMPSNAIYLLASYLQVDCDDAVRDKRKQNLNQNPYPLGRRRKKLPHKRTHVECKMEQ